MEELSSLGERNFVKFAVGNNFKWNHWQRNKVRTTSESMQQYATKVTAENCTCLKLQHRATTGLTCQDYSERLNPPIDQCQLPCSDTGQGQGAEQDSCESKAFYYKVPSFYIRKLPLIWYSLSQETKHPWSAAARAATNRNTLVGRKNCPIKWKKSTKCWRRN